jgi:hypothetical protein
MTYETFLSEPIPHKHEEVCGIDYADRDMCVLSNENSRYISETLMCNDIVFEPKPQSGLQDFASGFRSRSHGGACLSPSVLQDQTFEKCGAHFSVS